VATLEGYSIKCKFIVMRIKPFGQKILFVHTGLGVKRIRMAGLLMSLGLKRFVPKERISHILDLAINEPDIEITHG